MKGFSVKFYTEEGTHDISGLNFPVFIVRDPMAIFDVVRARKRNPQTHLFDPNALFDMTSYRPEMTMFLLFFFSDIAFPKYFRHIDGFAIHTFKMVNKNGEPVYVKFHFLSNQEKEFITLQESFQLAGSNPDLMVADLFDSIENKKFPSWTMKIQVMTFDQAKKHPYNPFDATKFWKEEDFPLYTVGELVLNQNPENYFVDVEQIAFSPGRMVPGIEASPDGLLHSRMFIYPDAQLHRLGTNYAQIPVNSCPFTAQTYQRDGMMNVGRNGGASPNYHPNSFHGLNSNSGSHAKEHVYAVSGDVDRVDIGRNDDFLLPKHFWKSRDPEEQDRIIANMAAVLGRTVKLVQDNVLRNIIYNIDEAFGDKLKAALN
ncbi:hypothetical protein HA402_011109 [Bradysia odoriphaga]|nr:hypothetical protein HA402_011109 [Bradysia odoriphaga]